MTYHLRRHEINVALDSSWSATLVRQDNRWLLASFNASTSLYDNPVVHLFVQKAQYSTGMWAGLAGLVLGIGACLVIRRRSGSSTTDHQESA